MNISENIRKVREAANLTQEEVALRMNTGRSNYSYLENRGIELTIQQLSSIAKALNVSIENLLYGGVSTPDLEKIKELQTGTSIFNFNGGDIIIRLKPVSFTQRSFTGSDMETYESENHGYRQPHEFIGIYNGRIYLRELKEHHYFKKKFVHSTPLEDWSQNWALFTVPTGLTIEDCIS